MQEVRLENLASLVIVVVLEDLSSSAYSAYCSVAVEALSAALQEQKPEDGQLVFSA